MYRFLFVALLLLMVSPILVSAQPETPIESWKGKTILLIGAHPDDDMYAAGTLAMLKAHGNEVYVALLTTGNVGTQDPSIEMFRLAEIRRQEELSALSRLGIPADHYINLGYDDGLLEFADRKEVVSQIVRLLRKIRPDVLFSFDPGKGAQLWHKSDHRTAAYLTADAARAAMWRLLFQGQIIHEGLQPFEVRTYILYDGDEKDKNLLVDISGFTENKYEADACYVSQRGSGWYKYTGPEMPAKEKEEFMAQQRKHQKMRDGKPVEGFRYYKGSIESIGR